jgi:NADH:ubiquinone oxidoreductase subunit E
MPEIECNENGPDIDFTLVDRIINEDFSKNRENLIMMMQAIQKQYRYLPRPALNYLSETIQVPITKIYEIATFYASFSLEPKGKHILCVCTGTACHLKGSGKMVEHITAQTGIGPGKTTADMKLTLETVNCVGACALAPVIVVDEKYYPEATLSTVIDFLDQVKAEE